MGHLVNCRNGDLYPMQSGCGFGAAGRRVSAQYVGVSGLSEDREQTPGGATYVQYRNV